MSFCPFRALSADYGLYFYVNHPDKTSMWFMFVIHLNTDTQVQFAYIVNLQHITTQTHESYSW